MSIPDGSAAEVAVFRGAYRIIRDVGAVEFEERGIDAGFVGFGSLAGSELPIRDDW